MLVAAMTGQNVFNLILCEVLCPKEFYYKYSNVCA